MKRTLKLILIIMIALFGIANKVEAASTTFEPSAKEVNVGDTITLTATVTAAQWDLGITLNGKTLTTSSELDNYESNITKTFTATYKATGEGKLTFTLKGDATDVSQKVEKINKSVTVNVKKVEAQKPTPEPEKPTTTTPSTPTTPEKPKVEEKPDFTEVNKKMYAKKDINLRDSWSTSSKATKIEMGTEITVTATSNNKVNGYVWYRVSYNGQIKYVASNLLSTTKPVEEEPEQPVEEPKEEMPEEPTTTADETEENTETTDELKGLKSLEVEGLTLSPKFETGTYNYEAVLRENITELKINTETIEEDGTVVIAGNTNIQEGENLITIIVYNKGEAVATYQIVVNKNTLDLTSTDEILKYGNQAATLKTTIYMIAIIVTTILLITVLIVRYKTQNKQEETQFGQEEKTTKVKQEKFAIEEEKKGKHF